MANYTDYFSANRAIEGTIYGIGVNEFGVGNDNLDYGVIMGACRFTNVVANQGATLNSAQLRMKVSLQGGGSGNLKYRVYGIDEDNTGDFSTNPFGRTKTTANETADIALPGAGNYTNIDVTSEVNEIIQRAGWSSGNAMGFLVENNGSPNDVWIYNALGVGDENEIVLSLRASALPDFTPGPYTQRVGRPPAKESFGIRVSKKGVDALTDNIQNLHVYSRPSILKAVRDAERGWPTGSNVENVSHGLKYPPSFLAFNKIGQTIGHANAVPDTSGLPLTGVYVNSEKIEMVLDPNASDPDGWYYYVFIDESK